MKKGAEITVVYVDVSQGANKSPEESRKRRREELNRGWRFTCSCSCCTLEEVGKSASADNDVSSSQRDESKVVDIVTRIDFDWRGDDDGWRCIRAWALCTGWDDVDV
jgi:import receptor subunit TOM20